MTIEKGFGDTMPVLTTSALRERVERGARLLDEQLPDWRFRIDPTRLDMHSGCGCVLGQLYDDGPFACESGYRRGLRELGLLSGIPFHLQPHIEDEFAESERHGFTVSCPEETSSLDWEAAWNALRAEWLRLLP